MGLPWIWALIVPATLWLATGCVGGTDETVLSTSTPKAESVAEHQATATRTAVSSVMPTAAESPFDEGVALLEFGEHVKAVEAATRAESEPQNAEAYYNRGTAYAELDQYQRAIQDLNEAIRLNPRFALAYINRGNAYNDLGQPQRAIEDYNEAIGLGPRPWPTTTEETPTTTSASLSGPLKIMTGQSG